MIYKGENDKEKQAAYFVDEHSIVRKIWGNADTVLFIFAGAAAEFALNKAVDWLYFTGKLPKDPLGRLFTTMAYARGIIFSPMKEANKTIAAINNIHRSIETARGAQIPDWAFRDVLFLLIYYSIAAYELLERRLSEAEKEEIYAVFRRVGAGMGLQELPTNFTEWKPERAAHLTYNLAPSAYTKDLYRQYKLHLGALRYRLLIEGQHMIVPPVVAKMLRFRSYSLRTPITLLYKMAKATRMDGRLKSLLLPAQYLEQVRKLDNVPIAAKKDSHLG